MEDLNFYQLAKKKMEFENIGVGNTALDETYPVREDIPAELWGKPIVVSAAPPYGPELIEEKHDPSHYQKGQIQVWDFIADQKLDYFKGNVVKYVCRAGSKSGESELDDLMKAKVYVEKAIELLALSD
jgi:hypothetical protein